MEDYRNVMAKNIPYPDKVRQIIQLKQQHTSMISKEFFDDLWRKPIPEVIEMFETMRQESLKEVLDDLKTARENGDIRQNIHPEFILYFLNHLTDMVKDKNLSKLYDSPNDLVMELTNLFFYSILPITESTGA